jgi:hypothetical protein
VSYWCWRIWTTGEGFRVGEQFWLEGFSEKGVSEKGVSEQFFSEHIVDEHVVREQIVSGCGCSREQVLSEQIEI